MPDREKTKCPETERLLFRKSRMEDWRDLYEKVWSRPEAARYMFWSVTAD